MKRFASIFILAAVIIIGLVWMGGYVEGTDSAANKNSDPERIVEKPLEQKASHLRMAVVGDIMMHGTQVRAGIQPDGSYNYDVFFREVKPFFAQADLVIGNLETTLAGQYRPYSSYPLFNSPDAIAVSLKNAGVDILQTVNNHSLDSRKEGLISTYNTVKETGILPVGTAPSPDLRGPVLKKQNGINICFSAYTESTNGLPIPAGEDYLLNKTDPQLITSDIQTCRDQNADLVVVLLHFGWEYHKKPSPQQRQLVEETFKAGADIILGSHPHVLQPMERVQVDGQEKFVIYSLGNFIADQQKGPTEEGIILYLDIVKDPQTNKTKLDHVSYLPTYAHRYIENGRSQFTVIPITDGDHPEVPTYPMLNEAVLKRAWNNTTTLMQTGGDFPIFSPDEDDKESDRK